MKNVIIVSGDKGGVGKSLIARVLAEMIHFQCEGASLAMIDGDSGNPHLMRFTQSIGMPELADVTEFQGVEKIMTDIEAAEDGTTFVIDLPANATKHLSDSVFMFEMLFQAGLAELNIVWALDTDRGTVEQLEAFAKQIENVPATFTIVKNRAFGTEFAWDQMALHQELRKQRGKNSVQVVELPDFDQHTRILEEIGERSLYRFANLEYEGTRFGMTLPVKRDLRECEASFAHILESVPRMTAEEVSDG